MKVFYTQKINDFLIVIFVLKNNMADRIELKPLTREELTDLVEQLDAIRGRHTELVTVYVPVGANLNVVVDQLEGEKSTARNIKSRTTQKNVIEALERIMRYLRTLNQQTPKNGLAVFSGNVSETEGQEDMRIWMIQPPEECWARLYRCDQVFILDPLKEMLEAKEVYGLFVIDRQEATIGILEGKKIKVLHHLDSGVPGKARAGGQCLAEDTLIMKDNGEIIPIKQAHNSLTILAENFNKETSEETPIITKWENKKQLYKIITNYPRVEINASKDHTFFARTEEGIVEKPLSELKEGDYLLMPEKINLNLQDQKIEFMPKIKQEFNMKKVKLPEVMTSNFAKLLGYYLGDGSFEQDRLTFFEQRKEVAEFYKDLIQKLFGIEVKLLFRKDKNYYQLRIYSLLVTQLFRQIFPEKEKTLTESIPQIVLKSSDDIVANFIGGFFDAEGYISSSRVGCGINNKLISRQIQFVLLRLGIISSLLEYDNRRNPYSKNIRYTIEISDTDSLKKFQSLIGFSSREKNSKLECLISSRKNRNNVRQLVVNGKQIARIIRNSGLDTTQFKCPSFFVNKRQISKAVFKSRILDKLSEGELKRRLGQFYTSNLIAVKIGKIEPLKEFNTVDIETKNHTFLANGLIVHNSAHRYERIIEGKARDFFRECGELMKKHFFDMKNLKGILIGGPMPTKEDFVKEGMIVTALKEKIIGMKDLGYANEHGLDLLVEGSQELLAQQEIIKEKNLMEKFFSMLGKQRDKIAYGLEPVKKALDLAAVDTLFLSKKIDKKLANELIDRARAVGAEIEQISVDTEEGQQFFNLSGIGATLRFSLEHH